MTSQIYSLDLLQNTKNLDGADTFAFVYEDEQRSLQSLKYFSQNKYSFNKVIVFSYYHPLVPENSLTSFLEDYAYVNIVIPDNPIHFIEKLVYLKEDYWGNSLVLDISCLKIPEMFSLLKFLKLNIPTIRLNISYSIPYDYHFPREPFTSYRSFSGDLTTYEMFGYSGSLNDPNNVNLYLFLGFEGSLSLKIVEDTSYNELILINNLPSFYMKYKDISIINNYQLMLNKKNKVLYTPADSPFETYNLLEKHLINKDNICIAPLSTKPVALGACMYALDHEDVRVIYPMSTKYYSLKTHDVHKTIVYSIPLCLSS